MNLFLPLDFTVNFSATSLAAVSIDLGISKKDTDVYTRLLDSEGEGEGGMIWENGNYNMYTINF